MPEPLFSDGIEPAVVTAKEPFINKVDRFMNNVEDTAATTSLALLGSAAATATSPVTAPAAPFLLAGEQAASKVGMIADTYQIARAIYGKRWDDMSRNAMELILGMIGAKLHKISKPTTTYRLKNWESGAIGNTSSVVNDEQGTDEQ